MKMTTTMTMLGWLAITVLSWAAEKKVEFILPQQVRSTAIPIEANTKNLEIEGHKVGFEVMNGAAVCYRVTDHLFVVLARKMEGGGLFLWDSKEKKVQDRIVDLNLPMLWPVAPKRRLIQRFSTDAGYYGVNSASKKFVKIATTGLLTVGTTDLLGGNSHRLFFLKGSIKSRSWTRSRGFGETTLEVIESGKAPVEIKVNLGGFAPLGSDAIRGNRLLLAKLKTKLEKEENRDSKTPPKYQVACWDFEKEGLEMLGEVEGTWVKSETPPPKGGWGRAEELGYTRPKIRWNPYLQMWWLPQEQEVKPIGYDPRYEPNWVDPSTMEITKPEPKASR